MESVLSLIRRYRILLFVSAALLVALAAVTGKALARTYSSTMTGYAYGNEYGASGTYIDQGDFANHSSTYCPGDPAAYWPYGTQITMVSPASVPDQDGLGNPTPWSVLTLEDIGDFACWEPAYWADNYFGRNATADEALAGCPCGGVTGYCFSEYWSNCQDAVNWGARSVTYNGP